MNWDNIDWKKFNCVDMARKIKDELEAELPTTAAFYDYLLKNRAQMRARTKAREAKLKNIQGKAGEIVPRWVNGFK